MTAECPLSKAELRALQVLLLTGSLKEAAAALERSPSTIRTQMQRARDRTGWSTERLVYEGTRAGWLRLP